MIKKYLCIIMVVLMLTLAVSSSMASDISFGDVQDTGSITVQDAILVLRHIVGLEQLNEEELQRARVSGDNKLTVGDAILILRYIVGLITEFPVEAMDYPGMGTLEVHFIDVGQGDCIFIKTPQNKTMLIDAGMRHYGQHVVNYLAQIGVYSIDIIVGTHAHADHIGGLITVIEELPVGRVIDSGKVHTTKTFEDYLDLIDEKDIPFELGRAGDVLDLCNKINIRVIHPADNIGNLSLNDASVVIKLLHGAVGFLFTGDAEALAEEQILARGYDLSKVNVLKVGHHGSRSSTTQSFLEAVSPSSAIIMCGKDNTYGHPHNEILQRLKRIGVDIYRTHLHGNIIVESDGSSYTVSTVPYEHQPVFESEPEKPDVPPAPGTDNRININTASLEELQEIVHIGPSRAQEIIDLRPFSSLDGLTRVSGIGPVRLQDIKDEGIAYAG